MAPGVRRYTQEVVQNILLLKENEITFIVFHYHDIPKDWFPESTNVVYRQCYKSALVKKRIIWENLLLPGAIYKEKCDIIWAPDYVLPIFNPFIKQKRIVTMHDVSQWKHPEWYSWYDRLFIIPWTKISNLMADRIITDSNFSKKEIESTFPSCNFKTKVIPLGVSTFGRDMCDASMKQITEKPYILHIGDFHPRRHVKELIDAFCLLKQKGEDIELVLVGNHISKTQTEIKRSIAKARERWGETSVKEFANVSEVMRISLLKHAKVFCYLSSYEGFGLPPLEAMSQRIPCLLGESECLKEICGEGAMFVEPENPSKIADSIANILYDGQVRESLLDYGVKRASLYKWDQCAEETRSLFLDLAQDRLK